MDIERRVSALEKKCVAPDERRLFFRELYEPVLGDLQAYDVMLEIAEQLARAKPELHKRLEAGEPVTDQEPLAEKIDPKLLRLLQSIIKEPKPDTGSGLCPRTEGAGRKRDRGAYPARRTGKNRPGWLFSSGRAYCGLGNSDTWRKGLSFGGVLVWPLENENRIGSVVEEYLTIGEVAARLKVEPKTVKNKMSYGIFRQGVHYFSPPGLRPRFKWSAVVAWLEQSQEPATESDDDSIPMPRSYRLREACTSYIAS